MGSSVNDFPTIAADLVCPVTRQRLRVVPLEAARSKIAAGNPLRARMEMSKAPVVGETETVLLRDDGTAAYPIVSGIPVLLAPEVLGDPGVPRTFDLTTPQYAEAYLEMKFYNELGFKEAETLRKAGSLAAIEGSTGSEALHHLERLRQRPAAERAAFPEPAAVWLHARLDLQSEYDCYRHIGSVSGQRILQLGGSGRAVLALLLAGAAEALLLTPMIGEALAATEIAALLGVSQRFRCVVAVAEEIPLADESVDVAFSAGCVHHMRTEIAFPEVARVLRRGGRFAALEPWRAPFYGIGTTLLGKRETNPFCHPMTSARAAPLFEAFRNARYELHGTLTRYPMLGLQKFGLHTSQDTAWKLGRADDWICSLLGLRRFGSGVALLASK
jgi:uncharacterized protein YbaR (Trm112 family)/ubiquinone/menaquinone biosynthesis C-methylase UbiE